MFVRQLKHPNGKIYIQVVSKKDRTYKVLKSFGSASSTTDIQDLVNQAKEWIRDAQGIQEFDFDSEVQQYTSLLENITSLKLIGVERVLGKIFDEIGFNQIADKLFRHLVLYRLVYPSSKLKTTEYLYRYEQEWYSEDDIYRYMDKLHSTQKEKVQQISYQHTKKVLGSDIRLVFYDVTTLYFDVDKSDSLRKPGFSKDGKHKKPQILLGLLVSTDGYPIAYEIFPGNKYEGHTMLPILHKYKETYNIDNLVVVADAGLLTKANIEELSTHNYQFILGARIKNESEQLKKQILSLSLDDGQSKVIRKGDLKLIISYSALRAKKDYKNRQKGLKKLRKKLKSGKLTKSAINNRGYNKYLILKGDVDIQIDENKFNEDKKWDGLKGYLTNSTFPKKQVLENYHHLWKIERAFRITKTDLKIRPIYHRLQRRIEAHICLNFAAYKVFKELERQLKIKAPELSAQKVIEILQNIHQIELTTPKSKKKIQKVLLLTEEQKHIAQVFQFGC